MSYQPDPRFFDWGSRIQEGMQQSQDNRRQNALLDLQNRQFGLNERRVNAEEARLAQSEKERQDALQAAQRKEGIGLRALAAARGDQQSGMAVLRDLGLPEQLAADPDASDMFAAIAEQYGGFQPVKQAPVGQLYKVGPEGRYVTAEQALGQPAYQEPKTPQDPGYSEGVGVNPRTGKPEKYLRDRYGRISWTGIEPPPQAASLKDQLEAEKTNNAKARVSGNLDALSEYYGELSNLGAAVDTSREGLGNVSAALRASGPGQIAGRVFGTQEQSVRNKINQMRPLLLQEIRQASAMGARGLDSNKELEFYLQAATDPARDIQANIAAINVLSTAYGLGKTYGEASPEGVASLDNEYLNSLPLVTSQEQYDKLASGTEYRDAKGRRWKKK